MKLRLSPQRFRLDHFLIHSEPKLSHHSFVSVRAHAHLFVANNLI